jgi:hypothetical protein
MTRLFVIAIVVAVALTVFAVVDVAYFDRLRVRGLPKAAWEVLILLVPVVGALLWFFIGRGPRGGRPRRGGSGRHGPIAPDDDPDFLRNLKFPKPDGDSDKS